MQKCKSSQRASGSVIALQAAHAMLSEAVSTERAVSSLKEVYQQACSQVESEVAEPEKHQLQLLGHRLCDSVDDAKISRIRRLYAEFSADPRNAGLQGGCGEIWTFRDGGDLDISFPMQLAPRTHESQVKLRDRGENGEFQLAIEPNGNESELWYLRTLWSWRKSYSLQLDIVYASLLVFFHILFISNGDWKRWITSAIVIPNDSVISAMLSRMKTSAISIPRWLDGIPALPILRGISFFTRILSPVTLLSRIPGVRNLLVKLNPSESHGPADTDDDIRQRYGSIKTKGVDIVSFVPAPPDVEQLLVEWRCRHQRRFVNSQHFDRLVPACGDLGMVMFDTMHQLWRLSLTEFECQWIRNLPKEQGLVLSVAKLLAKDSQLTDGHPVTSYPIKMSFFWFVYFSADSDWTPQRVCLNALKVLRFLEICFEKKSLPNYFYLDENVLWKYKKDAMILVKIPAITKAVGHFLKNNLLEEKQVQNRIHGIEKLLDVFCSGKLEAWNPWRTGNFLATRLYNLESSQETRVGLAAVTHVCLIVLVQVLIVPVALVTSNDAHFKLLAKLGLLAILESPIILILFALLTLIHKHSPYIVLSLVEIRKRPQNTKYKPYCFSKDEMREIFLQVQKDLDILLTKNREDNNAPFANQATCASAKLSGLFSAEIEEVSRLSDHSSLICFNLPGESQIASPVDVKAFRVPGSDLVSRLLRIHGAWFDVAFTFTCMAAEAIVLHALAVLQHYPSAIIIPLSLVLPFLAVNYDYYRRDDLRINILRSLGSALSKLPIRLPTRVARLAHCLLAGEARLRVRTGQPDETLVLLDARRLTWRLCTDLRERRALACMSGGHKLSYSAVLSLARRLGVTRSNFEPLRVAFHWTASLMPDPQHWTVQNSLRNALLVLELCRRCHRRASLPNFFHPAENVALVRPETFNGVPKCHVILAHLLQADSSAAHRAELVSRLRCELEAVAEEEEVANAAAWGVGMLAARVIMLAGDLAFHAVFATAIFACVTPLIHMINAPRS